MIDSLKQYFRYPQRLHVISCNHDQILPYIGMHFKLFYFLKSVQILGSFDIEINNPSDIF